MGKNERTQAVSVYCDFIPNHARDPALVEELKARIIEESKGQADQMVARLATLPTLMVHHPFGDYVPLLREAREIYIRGYFYSCVAMCGITAERMVKDILRGSVMVRSGPAQATQPVAKAFDQLERVDVSSLARFLLKASIIEEPAWKALDGLFQLRNTYAHARGEAAESDALKAIQYLHTFVDHTTSVLKHNEIRDGKLVPKPA